MNLYDDTSVNSFPSINSPILDLIPEVHIRQKLFGLIPYNYSNAHSILVMLTQTELYQKLIWWTFVNLADFLSKVHNKTACAHIHEKHAIMHRYDPSQITATVFTPEICQHKDFYSGCGHLWLNGILVAISIWAALRDILEQKTWDLAHARMAAYSLRHNDSRAWNAYAENLWAREIDMIRETQKRTWDDVAAICHDLAQYIARNLWSLN